MAEEDDTGGYSQSNSNSNTILLRTNEDVAKELKRWISTDSDVSTNKIYDNAIKHIESNLNRPLSCWETTWTEWQYVKTSLKLWLEKSLRKAFDYINSEENDFSTYMSIVLSQ